MRRAYGSWFGVIGAGMAHLNFSRAARRWAGLLAAWVALGSVADAAILYWDNNSGSGIGGTGNWVTSNLWNTSSGGGNGTRTNWTNGRDAYFGGTVGTVTVNSAVTVNAIVFQVSGYTISGANNITLGASSTTVGTGAFNATISAPLVGASKGLNKTGTGTLTLSGTNTYSGGTILGAGTLALGSSGAIGTTGTITFNGGVLQFSASNTTDYSSRFATTASQTFEFDTNGQNVTFANALTSTSGTLTKSGTGTLTLSSGANAYSGATTINGGTLSVGTLANGGASSSIGTSSNAAANLVIDGGTLRFTGATANTDRLLTIGTGGATIDASGTGALSFTSNNDSIIASSTGSRTLTLTGTNTGANSFNSVIVNPSSGTTALTKSGTGSWTLGGNLSNTFTGTSTIGEGTLILSKTSGATALSSTIVIGNGAGSATLQLGAANQIPTAAALTFNNTGGTPILDLNGFSQTLGSIATTNTSAQIQLGTPGSATTFTVGDANTTSYSGSITGGANAAFVKQGSGTLTLNGSVANTFTGSTTVSAGTLILSKTGGGTALGSTSVTIGDGTGTDTLQLGGSNQLSSSAALTFNSAGTPILNLNGNSQTVASISTTNTSAQIQLGSPGSATTFTFGDANNLTYNGTFTGGSNAAIVKQGTGTVTLGSASSNTGAVTIANGKVNLRNASALGNGSGGTTVNSGATLELQGSINATNGTLTLNGSGYTGSAGALVGVSGDNRWYNNIALGSNATISNNSTGFLGLGQTSPTYVRPGTPTDTHTLSLGSNTLTLTGTGTIYANARITGTGNVTIDMTNTASETWFTANMNTFTGTTSIKNGTFVLATTFNTYPNDPANPNYFGINGPVIIGDGTGSADSAILKIQAGTTFTEMMNFTTNVTMNKDGKFHLLDAQSINTLTFNGGHIDLGATGSLYLNNTVTVNASAGNTALIEGTGTSSLSLTIHQGPSPVPNANRTFNVIGGVGNTSDLTISSVINNGSITKTGVGTMTITGNNTFGYEGTTTIDNGIINIQHGNALGQQDGSNTTSTTVNGNGTTNGTLQLQGGITVTNEKLFLNNTGYLDAGALNNKSGNNTWAGAIVLSSDARVQSDAGLLTISGTVTSSANANLDVRGSGNTTISGVVGTGSGGITKNGTGTLILSGSNTYSGNTTITQGVLSLQNNNGLGDAGFRTTVAGSGAALELSNAANGNLTTASEPLYLNGTGVSGNGALRNAAGNNTFGGLVTATTSALITANNATSLTISGGTNVATGQTLTFGHTTNNGNITVSGNMSINGSTSGTGASLVKNGTGTLTLTGSTSAAGNVTLSGGTIAVGAGSALAATKFDSSNDGVGGTTLTIGSGGSVTLNQAAGITSTFSGVMAGSGSFTFNGTGSTSVLALNHTGGFDASSLTLNISGGTLSLLGGEFKFGTINITGNTVLDFNSSAGTFLTSSILNISAGVTITVNGWMSVASQATNSTMWRVTNTSNGVQGSSGSISNASSTQYGTPPLNQITFNNYGGMTTTWVSGTTGVPTTNGWFGNEIRPTPEPSTYGLIFISGCVGLLGYRRYRATRAAASSR